MSAWISIIQPADADEQLTDIYQQVQSPHGTVDNVMKVHSLQPQTMLGHLALYKSILHNPDITLADRILEIIASYTSILNQCDYSLTHHFMNARRFMGDDEQADRVLNALQAGRPETVFSGKELALLEYAGKLTTNVGDIRKSDVDSLRAAGCCDTEILEVNQVVAYFNYSNRVLNGLGVTTDGDVVGYYE
jgi:uncharacterized peroxidase-related enzyme